MTLTALVFEKGHAEARGLPQAREAIGKAPLVWIDTDERTPEIDALLAGLSLHPLTVEDIFEARKLPKVEDYGSYLFVLAHAVHVPATGPVELRHAELDIVVGSGWIFTHHDGRIAAPARVREEVARAERPLDAAGVLHLLLDRLVDDALPAMDAFDDAVERLEQASLRRIPRRDTVVKVMALRAALHRFRRTAVHQREVLLRLARGEFAQIPRDRLPFFRDVHDHAVRIADLIEDARDLLGGVLEAHLSMVSNRLNEIMKVLTMIATVFLPLSFIASVYGMNFEGMPELHWRLGYPVALAAMGLTAAGLLLWFKRRGWLE
ncbi:MAG TPA: magnesium/cobalt transporter CorA [Myxococcales bacterium]|nr:magnesium/cobalt transporter CorA [Myxococcales bacterium]